MYLTINNLTKIYRNGSKQNTVFNGASAKWKSGLIHAIVGKNGSGKSTLLQILAGLTHPTDCQIDGTVSAGRTAFLSANSGLHENLTIRENIEFFARITCNPKVSSFATDTLLSNLDLINYQHKYPSNVSTGVIQKTRIAGALYIEPKLLLMDEPTSGLDISAKSVFYNTLKILKTNDTLILIATHDLGEITTICDTLSLVHNGGITQLDDLNAMDIDTLHSFLLSEFSKND